MVSACLRSTSAVIRPRQQLQRADVHPVCEREPHEIRLRQTCDRAFDQRGRNVPPHVHHDRRHRPFPREPQTPIGNGHSSAILMGEESAITDPEIVRLCDEIVKAQREEIAQMEGILERY